jgi:hypothetical protein
MRDRNRIYRWRAFGVLVLILCKAVAAQPGGGVTVSYVAPRADLTLKEPVFIDFRVENRTLEAIQLDLGENYYGGFQATVVRPDGRVVNGGGFGDGIATRGNVTVPPMGVYSRRLLFNRWFDFDMPGRYLVDVRLTNPIRGPNQADLSLPADGHAVIEIGQRDPARLERTCAELEAAFSVTRVVADILPPAEALGYIDDPVAFPFLERMLRKPATEGAAMAGLGRIADAPSVEALLAHAANARDGGTRNLVRMTLLFAQSRTADAAVKQRIRDALQR